MLRLQIDPERILALGVTTCVAFPVADIVFSDHFRDMCKQNYCGNYGKNYTCPPDVGEIADLKERALAYTDCLLFQTIAPIEDSYDFEGMTEVGKLHNQNIDKVELYVRGELGITDFLMLGAGGCGLCERCGKKDGIPCRFPDKARASVEAFGMDVRKLTEEHGLHYINGVNTVSYVALMLYNKA